MTEHTPTPWKTDGTHVLDDRRQVVAVCRQARPRNTMEAIANAEFIVRACNAHAELLAACKAAYSLIGQQWAGPSLEVSNQIAAAIARAEGK